MRFFLTLQKYVQGYPAWNNTKPHYKTKSTRPDGSEYHSWESWGETIIICDDLEVGDQVLNEYISLVDSGLFNDRIEKILSDRDEWGKENDRFQSLIEQEAEKVRLGEIMKGKCDVCRKFDIF